MSMEGYEKSSHHRSGPSLRPDDSRVGWISVRDSRAFSASCDRWLESRGVRTRSAWVENRTQFGKKK